MGLTVLVVEWFVPAGDRVGDKADNRIVRLSREQYFPRQELGRPLWTVPWLDAKLGAAEDSAEVFRHSNVSLCQTGS